MSTKQISEEELDSKLKQENYMYLGWSNGWLTERYINTADNQVYFRYVGQPEYQACIDSNHNDWRNEEHYESVQHTRSGSRFTYYCEHCKIF